MLSRDPVLIVALRPCCDSWTICTISYTDIRRLDLPRFPGAITTLAFRCSEVWLDPDSVGKIDCTGPKSEDEDVEEDAACFSKWVHLNPKKLTFVDRRCWYLARRWRRFGCMPEQCRKCSHGH